MSLPNHPASAADVDTLARTCWGEARGEGLNGMVAVAWVACNRAAIAEATGRAQFGDGSIASACRVPWQFSSWNESDPNRAKLEAVTLDEPSFQQAMLAALLVVTGNRPDPTQGATFYWADSIATPAWAHGKPYVSIGRQKFIADA